MPSLRGSRIDIDSEDGFFHSAFAFSVAMKLRRFFTKRFSATMDLSHGTERIWLDTWQLISFRICVTLSEAVTDVGAAWIS